MGSPQHLHLYWFGSNLRNNYDLLSSKWGMVRAVLVGKPSWATQETTSHRGMETDDRASWSSEGGNLDPA